MSLANTDIVIKAKSYLFYNVAKNVNTVPHSNTQAA